MIVTIKYEHSINTISNIDEIVINDIFEISRLLKDGYSRIIETIGIKEILVAGTNFIIAYEDTNGNLDSISLATKCNIKNNKDEHICVIQHISEYAPTQKTIYAKYICINGE